ncbi:MAG: hypothetical protein JRI25_29760 [Deltaproteobacteria bacterium]|nr:hypothetical protein [Deltaproteobacteria bacterium]
MGFQRVQRKQVPHPLRPGRTRDSYRGSYDVNEGTWTLSGNKFKADFGGTVLSFEKLDGCTMGGSVTFAGESEGIPYRASRKWPACGC